MYDSEEEIVLPAEDGLSNAAPASSGHAMGSSTRYIYPTSLPYQYPGNAYNLHFPSGLSFTKSPASTVPTPLGQPADTRISSLVHENVKLEDVGESGQLSDLPLSNARFALNMLRNNRNNTNTSAGNSAITPWMYTNSVACVGGALSVQQRGRLARVPKMPPLAPVGRPELHPSKLARLSAILCASDSEDERVHIPKFRRGEEIGK